MTKVTPLPSLSQQPIQYENVNRLSPKYRDKDPAIVEAAQGMEAMFLDYLMKVMRQTVPKNEMDLESGATEIYRSMLDSEVAQKSAQSQGVGLADQLIDYLDSSRYTQMRTNPGPKMGPKGVGHEGR
jgi:flagellar protein FlgJ